MSEPEHDTRGAIVVGVTDGPVAAAAADWAGREATRRGVDVVLVHAFVVPVGRHPGLAVGGLDVRHSLTLRARRTLAEVAARVREVAPGTAVQTRLVEGGALAALRASSADAGAVVVGSDGLGPLLDLALGGIVRGLCREGEVPVVVVPYHQDADPGRWPASRTPVVVGDDGSPEAAAAVAFAVDRAADRHALLVVVRAGAAPSPVDDPLHDAGAVVALRVVEAGTRADRVLLEEAGDAEIVVIGRGVHHLFRPHRRTRPGVLARATCPVVVVPPRRLTPVGSSTGSSSAARPG